MFLHESQLRHVLPPRAYFAPEQYQQELDRCLLSGWHLVASMGDFKRDGDYVTLDLFNKPLLVRRIDGEAHVYLNICGHRHCMLVSKPKGHEKAFRCQYHGWEYQCDGRTAKIPDAQSFRPFDRENARILKYRSERCGDLIFVNLSSDGPSLKDQLAETYQPIADAFSQPFRQIWGWNTTYPANWKIAIENLLESYHIPCLHQKTFGVMPPEEMIIHEMNDRWTSFYTEDVNPWIKSNARRTARALGLPFRGMYTQYHVYPNLVFILMDTFSLAKMVVPTSPTTSQAIVRVFGPYGPRRTPLAWISARLNTLVAKEGARKILEEDASIFAAAQKGMESSPVSGVIGRREERVWAFQDWIRRKCGIVEPKSHALPVLDPSSR